MRRWTIFLLLLLFFSVACQTEEPTAVGFLRGDFAFIPYQERVQIIDISDAAQPEFFTEVTMPGYIVKVVVNGRYLYIAHSTSATSWNSETGPPDAGLQIVDISDPRHPKFSGFFRTPEPPTALAIKDNLAYVGDWQQIIVVDISDPESPHERFTLDQYATGLAIDNGLLVSSWGGCGLRSGYCEGGLQVYDLSNPAQPELINEMQPEKELALPGFSVALNNNYAFVSGKGLWVVGLQNREQLQMDGRYASDMGWLSSSKVLIDNQIAYMSQYDGVHILDISQSTSPKLLALYQTSNQLTDLALRNGRLYLAGWGGLEILDITDSTNPTLLGYYATEYPGQIFPQPSPTP